MQVPCFRIIVNVKVIAMTTFQNQRIMLHNKNIFDLNSLLKHSFRAPGINE